MSEKFPGGQEYRDQLAKDIKEKREADPAVAREWLKSDQGTPRYKAAREQHHADIDAKKEMERIAREKRAREERELREMEESEEKEGAKIGSPIVKAARNLPDDSELLRLIREWAETVDTTVNRGRGYGAEMEMSASAPALKIKERCQALGYVVVSFHDLGLTFSGGGKEMAIVWLKETQRRSRGR